MWVGVIEIKQILFFVWLTMPEWNESLYLKSAEEKEIQIEFIYHTINIAGSV